MIGYDSQRIKDAVLESLKFKPDAIVIFTGNNEWLFDPCRGAANEFKKRYFLFASSLYDFWGHGREKLFQLSVSRHLSNVGKIKSAAKARNVEVFLVLLPSNLLFPPFGERPYLPDYLRGYDYLESGNYNMAYLIFSKLAEKEEPFANYYAGLSLYRDGKIEQSFAYLEKAAAFDNKMDRTTPKRNSILRNYALKKGIRIIDLEKFFMNFSQSKIITPDLFNDGVHWDGIYNCHVQKEVLKSLDSFYKFPERNISCKAYKREKQKLNSAKFLAHQKKIIDERVLYDINKYLNENGAKKVYERIKKYGIKEILDSDSNEELERTGKKDLFIAHIAEAYRRMALPEKSIEILLMDKIYTPEPNKLAVLALSARDLGKRGLFNSLINDYLNRLVYDKKLSVIIDFCGFNGINFLSKEPSDKGRAKEISDLAVEKIKDGKIDEAALLIKEALSAYPYDFESLMNAAYIADLKKMPEKAIFYLNGIIEKKNRPREHICAALNMRSSMFKKIKNIGKSREDLIEASEICLK